MAKYVINDKEVTEEYFYKQVFNMDEKTIKNTPFFLDEVIESISMSPKTDEEVLKTLLNPHLKGSELREEWKTTNVDMSKAKGNNVLKNVIWESEEISPEDSKKLKEIRVLAKKFSEKEKLTKDKNAIINNQNLKLTDILNIVRAESEEELEDILKRDMSIGAPDWSQNDTGGTVFEKLQDSTLPPHSLVTENLNKAQENYLKNYCDRLVGEKTNEQSKSNDIEGNKPKTLSDSYLKGSFSYPIKDKYRINFYEYVNNVPILQVKEFEDLLIAGEYFNKSDYTEAFVYGYKTGDLVNTWNKVEGIKSGKKENKNKPQLSLLFKQFPKALESITKCSEYGNNKYKETDQDFLNFKRVEGGSKTYADSGLRHRLETGLDESGLPHQYHVAWNSMAELELWIEENEQK